MPDWLTPDWVSALADVVQGAAAVAIAIVGGLWALRTRRVHRTEAPKANVSHEVSCLKIDARHLVHVSVKIENVGQVPIDIPRIDLRIQRIWPLDAGDEATLLAQKWIGKSNESAWDWPTVAQTQEDIGPVVRIEPGERDALEYDFVVENDRLDQFQVYSFMKAKEDAGVGWRTVSRHRGAEAELLHGARLLTAGTDSGLLVVPQMPDSVTSKQGPKPSQADEPASLPAHLPGKTTTEK